MATNLPTGDDLVRSLDSGLYTVTDPVGLDAGLYIVEVVNIKLPTNFNFVRQRALNTVTGEASVRSYLGGVALDDWAAEAGGGGSPGAGLTLLNVIEIEGDDSAAINGTWTNSSDATRIFVQLQAPGGGSGAVVGESAKAAASGGGGGGGYIEGWFDVDGVASMPYTLTKSNAGSDGEDPAEGGSGINVFNDPLGGPADGLAAFDGAGSADQTSYDVPHAAQGGGAGIAVGLIGANLLSSWGRTGEPGKPGLVLSDDVAVSGAGGNAGNGCGGAAATAGNGTGAVSGQAPDAGADAAGAGASGAVSVDVAATSNGGKGGKAHLRIWEYA